MSPHEPRVAEFFAGIGLVRMGLERAGCRVVFANDISEWKRDIYAANFDAQCYMCGDVRGVHGSDVPDVEIASASFPCTDLSLAGNRVGLAEGEESGLLVEFLRVLQEMGSRRPPVVLLENVMGFATSHGGNDLRGTIEHLNLLGYSCDILELDARRFVPQSRPRLFIVGLTAEPTSDAYGLSTDLRPSWVGDFAVMHPELRLHRAALPELPQVTGLTLDDVLEAFQPDDPIWWDGARLTAFLASLSPTNVARLQVLRDAPARTHAAAYRRTRDHVAVWEIRSDRISGCLRTARGGSSKQAVVQAGRGQVRVRWMTAAEYARLQGAPGFDLNGATESQGKFALGDAVCVPAVAWLAQHYLAPAVRCLVGFDARAEFASV